MIDLLDELFQKAQPDIRNRQVIDQFNERAESKMELDNLLRTNERLKDDLEQARQYGQITRGQYEDALYRIKIAEKGRREMSNIARMVLLGVLAFCLFLLLLLLVGGVL